MNKIKSTRLKCRNLPYDQEPVDCINSKPIVALCCLIVLGVLLLLRPTLFFLGLFAIGIAIHGIFFAKDNILVEFNEQYAIFYLDEKREDCYVLYWMDVISYEFIQKAFDTDQLSVELVDGQVVMFKVLNKRILQRNFKKFTHVIPVIDEEE